jgi:dTDP-D-glucose 4,6-dehydratase
MPLREEYLRRAPSARALTSRRGLADTVAWYRDNAEWVRRCRSGEYRQYYEKMYGEREATAAKL